jgi:hypothetical protein
VLGHLLCLGLDFCDAFFNNDGYSAGDREEYWAMGSHGTAFCRLRNLLHFYVRFALGLDSFGQSSSTKSCAVRALDRKQGMGVFVGFTKPPIWVVLI